MTVMTCVMAFTSIFGAATRAHSLSKSESKAASRALLFRRPSTSSHSQRLITLQRASSLEFSRHRGSRVFHLYHLNSSHLSSATPHKHFTQTSHHITILFAPPSCQSAPTAQHPTLIVLRRNQRLPHLRSKTRHRRGRLVREAMA